MKLLIFDLVGKMAHFRKMDMNSSSMSYSFPPRTTIAGLLAGIIGLERDSYYELFSSDDCYIAVSVRTPFRKIVQTVNYMLVKSEKDLNNSQGHTQIPIEFVLPAGNDQNLRYRIYFFHKDKQIYQLIKERIERKRYVYPPYLGLSELLGQIDWVAETEGQWIETNEPIQIHTIARINELKERTIQISGETQFFKEYMTRDFSKERTIQETDYYLFEKNHRLIAVPEKPYLEIQYRNVQENVMFL